MSFAVSCTGWFISATGRFLEPIWFGFALLTLGFRLMVDFETSRDWPKIIIYQILAGLGVGQNFQAQLIAMQNGFSPQDIAIATAAFGFDRNLASSIGIVIGGAIFQNGVQKQAVELMSSLGNAANFLIDGGAIASIAKIDSLPNTQKALVQDIFRNALKNVWIFAVAFSGVGLLITGFIKTTVLSDEHVEVRVGIKPKKTERGQMLRH